MRPDYKISSLPHTSTQSCKWFLYFLYFCILYFLYICIYDYKISCLPPPPPHNRANDFCIFCIFAFCIFCLFVFMTTRYLVSHLHLQTIVQMYFVFLVFLAFLVFLVFLVFWPQDLLSASHLHTIVQIVKMKFAVLGVFMWWNFRMRHRSVLTDP